MSDSIGEALNTCEYFLSKQWIDHYLYSNTKLYIDVGLHNAAVASCRGHLNMAIEIIITKYIFSTVARYS